jgi:hypothetical protein
MQRGLELSLLEASLRVGQKRVEDRDVPYCIVMKTFLL